MHAKYNIEAGRSGEKGAFAVFKNNGFRILSFKAVWILFIILKTALKRDKRLNSISQTKRADVAVSHNPKFNSEQGWSYPNRYELDKDGQFIEKRCIYGESLMKVREHHTFI